MGWGELAKTVVFCCLVRGATLGGDDNAELQCLIVMAPLLLIFSTKHSVDNNYSLFPDQSVKCIFRAPWLRVVNIDRCSPQRELSRVI